MEATGSRACLFYYDDVYDSDYCVSAWCPQVCEYTGHSRSLVSVFGPWGSFSPNLKFAVLTRLAGQWAASVCCLRSPVLELLAFTAMASSLHGCWESDSRSSGLQGELSYPQSHLPRPLACLSGSLRSPNTAREKNQSPVSFLYFPSFPPSLPSSIFYSLPSFLCSLPPSFYPFLSFSLYFKFGVQCGCFHYPWAIYTFSPYKYFSSLCSICHCLGC